MRNENKTKGFYIVLFLCVTAIGTAGYVNFSTADETEFVVKDTTVSLETSEIIYPEEEIIPTPIIKETEQVELDVVDVPDIVVQSETVETPVEPTVSQDEVIIEVTKPQAITYVRPVDGQVINPNSNDDLVLDQTMNTWRTHNATDFSATSGTNVVAIADGVVRSITTDDLYGTVITIEHADGLVTKTYGLNADTVAKIDKEVVAGDVIGTAMGIFPAEEQLGEHIHVEATKDGVDLDVETLFE